MAIKTCILKGILLKIVDINKIFSDESFNKTYGFFKKMKIDDFEGKWYKIHDAVGDLAASGLQKRRVVSYFITFDPQSIDVNKFK